ncbi:hypothetical protein JDV02_000130 [Purpureocillium takamizusanense]|uniref:FAD/NAD(P)-binding domain-containing protein n=1 Tax=Purpureocillium takamizusanense TaxID=2060973 RepID=A0A9Q8Q6G3_9HYPO|nr:uncharacterized protein JDV02_000130 [Purpureocillium takamizusanense]UNI13381.1 hypothetical protein JDV02_000130 [Purpureocillium takamizusanense]
MPSAVGSKTTVRVLIAGGSYAGLAVAVNLLDLHHGLPPRMAPEPYVIDDQWPKVQFEIVIVDERDGFFHVVGSPLALADFNYSKQAWVPFKDLKLSKEPNVKFIHGKLSHVDCSAKRATVLAHDSNEENILDYDYMVTATGLRRDWPVVPQSLTYSDYLAEVHNHIKEAQNARHGVMVVGGGAVGVEMAAELKLVMPDIKVMLAHSRDKLLSSEGLTDECKDTSLDLLKGADVETFMGHRMESCDKIEAGGRSGEYDVKFTNGVQVPASMVITAISNGVPSTRFLPGAAVAPSGHVRIQPNLMFPADTPNFEYHYCAGDAAKWSGIKRCGGAMHGGYCIAMNIHQKTLENSVGHEPQYRELVYLAPMIAMAVGKSAVASNPDSTRSGPEVLKKYFGTDLYLSGCWKWLGLEIPESERSYSATL